MANSFLKQNKYNIPKKVLNHLSNTLNSYTGNKKVLGYVRTKNIVNKGYLTYENMKFILSILNKLKNPANSSGNQRYNTILYNLNGGEVLQNWIQNTLDLARKQVDNRKQMKKNSGFENAERKSHTKSFTNGNISVPKLENKQIGDFKMVVSESIFEHIVKNLK